MKNDSPSAAEMAKKLGRAQQATVLSLTDEWGAAYSHQAAKRLWYRNDIPLLLDHKHCTDNCWQLRPIGLAVRAHLQAASDEGQLCDDCPPVGYPTDETRCLPCPRRTSDDAPCTDCRGTGITIQTERKCACQP